MGPGWFCAGSVRLRVRIVVGVLHVGYTFVRGLINIMILALVVVVLVIVFVVFILVTHARSAGTASRM